MSILLQHHNPANQMMGQILVSQQWVTPTQLESALAEQSRSNQKLGEVMVRLGHLSTMELDFILAQQKGNTLTGETDTVKQRLGDILKKSKRLSPRQLSTAVDEQKKTNEKLGEVLLRLGLLDGQELDACLAWQDEFNQADPLAVRLLLGEILIASKRLSRKQLADALANQKMTKKQIGQVLVDCGFVSKFDIRNALKIQTKMVAAGLLAMMMAGPLTGCAAPTVPGTGMNYSKATYDSINKGARKSTAYNTKASYKVASLPGGRGLMSFSDGARVIKDVPFVKQGGDNTCAQATTTVALHYWGVEKGDIDDSYQELVNKQNRLNLATGYQEIIKTCNANGLQAKAMRGGTLPYLKSLVDQGKPAIALLEFNEDLFQQHYITVIGYNSAKGTVIFHDSIDGPYRTLDEDEFIAMWQSKHLANLPVFGGANYQGLILEISKPS